VLGLAQAVGAVVRAAVHQLPALGRRRALVQRAAQVGRVGSQLHDDGSAQQVAEQAAPRLGLPLRQPLPGDLGVFVGRVFGRQARAALAEAAVVDAQHRKAKGMHAAHALGAAAHVPARANAMNAQPAALDTPGSLLSIVPIFNECGFAWGGHFSTGPDGMHFELALRNP
jgi:hypothetical protein